jgi:hypothetical protein
MPENEQWDYILVEQMIATAKRDLWLQGRFCLLRAQTVKKGHSSSQKLGRTSTGLCILPEGMFSEMIYGIFCIFLANSAVKTMFKATDYTNG